MLYFHVHYTLYNYKYLGKKGFPQPEVSITLTKSQLAYLYSLVIFLSTQIMVVKRLLSGIAVYMGRGSHR